MAPKSIHARFQPDVRAVVEHGLLRSSRTTIRRRSVHLVRRGSASAGFEGLSPCETTDSSSRSLRALRDVAAIHPAILPHDQPNESLYRIVVFRHGHAQRSIPVFRNPPGNRWLRIFAVELRQEVEQGTDIFRRWLAFTRHCEFPGEIMVASLNRSGSGQPRMMQNGLPQGYDPDSSNDQEIDFIGIPKPGRVRKSLRAPCQRPLTARMFRPQYPTMSICSHPPGQPPASRPRPR